MPWLSLPDYSRQTGTPESTVRAAIRKGQIRAELEQRAPGDSRTVWRVWLDDPPDQPQDDPPSPVELRMPSEAPQPPAASTEPSAATTKLLDTVLSQAERIAELSRQLGGAEARAETADRERARADDLADTLIALRASHSAAQAERDRLKAELAALRRPWYRRWWLAGS